MDRPGINDRRLRQVGAVSAACLAARRHGRPDAGLCADSCGDDGHRRPVHADAHERHVSAFADDDAGGRRGRRVYRDLCGDDWHHAKRHQESSGLLNCLAAWLHVSGLRRGRVRDRNLSRDDARVFQGADVSRRRQRDSRHASRAGHAKDGPAQ